jgi:hypothetical protein
LKIEPGSLVGANPLANPCRDELMIGDEHCFFPPVRQGLLLATVRRLDHCLPHNQNSGWLVPFPRNEMGGKTAVEEHAYFQPFSAFGLEILSPG